LVVRDEGIGMSQDEVAGLFKRFGRMVNAQNSHIGGTGRQIRTLLRAYSDEPVIRAQVLVLPPGHVYRAVALMAGTAARDAIAKTISAEKIDSLLAQAEEELRDPELRCTSLILVQGYARLP